MGARVYRTKVGEVNVSEKMIEPIIRIIFEAKTKEKAERLVNEAKAYIADAGLSDGGAIGME